MKGFLKKDLALLYNTGKVYLAVIAMGIVLGLVNKEMRSFSSSFIMIMLALAGASTLSYDDFENGMPFLISLPVSKKNLYKRKVSDLFFIRSGGTCHCGSSGKCDI